MRRRGEAARAIPPPAILRGCALTLLLATLFASVWAATPYEPYPAVTELPPVNASQVEYALELRAEELPLPVSLTPLGDGSGRLLLVSLLGRVWLLDEFVLRPEPFLDLAGRVTGRRGEQGLFTVALEPPPSAGDRPRRLVAAFTEAGDGDLVVAAFPLTPDLERALPHAGREIFRLAMPEPFHHGGQVAFGPDGMLYLSIGSGELSTERLHVTPAPSQDPSSYLGKMLRLDLSAEPYAVPPDNPFTIQSDPAAARAGAKPEIWASGFRNPWKFTFGPEGSIYLADVGADRWEEVNLVTRGANYGWPAREGRECFILPDVPAYADPECGTKDLTDPVAMYGHLRLDPAGGQAITGGVVVQGPHLPELLGRYVYGDFVSGRVWSYDLESGRVELLIETGLPLSEISAGANGELLLLDIGGRLFELVHAR